jgi:hypothetical protein
VWPGQAEVKGSLKRPSTTGSYKQTASFTCSWRHLTLLVHNQQLDQTHLSSTTSHGELSSWVEPEAPPL